MFFKNPALLFGIIFLTFVAIRPFVPPTSFDSGVRFEQAVIDGKQQTVRVVTSTKMVQYHGEKHWSDTHRDWYSIIKKGGKIVVFAMPISGPWTVDDAKPENAALWRRFFNS